MAHHLSRNANTDSTWHGLVQTFHTYLLMAEVIVACSQYLTQSPFHFRFDHLSIPANQKKRFPLRSIAGCRVAQSPKLMQMPYPILHLYFIKQVLTIISQIN